MDYFVEDFFGPPQSYSRKMDNQVWTEEMPYGYTNSPPPADTGDYNQRALESNVRIMPRKHGKR